MNRTGSENDSCQITETSVELNDRHSAAFLPLTVALGFLLALGILGNLLTLLVFTLNRDYRRNTFKVFVIAMALIDLITCVTLFPTEIMTHRYYFLFKSASLCKAKCSVTVFGASASCLALLVISVDRYRKVMQPLKKQLTPSLTAVSLLLIIFIFPVMLTVPATIMCGINHTSKENIYGEQTEIFLCETEEKFKHSKWRKIYKYVLIILQLGISVVYVILYAFVMKEALKHIKALRSRESFSSSLGQIKPSLKTDDGDTIQDKHVHEENGNLVSNIAEGLLKKNSAAKYDSSLENDHDISDGGILMQKDLAKKSPSVSSVRVKKSKRSQISIISQRRKYPTKTLVWFVLTIIFIITNVTHLGLSLKRKDIIHMSPTELFWFLVFFRAYFINHVINPVVYTLFLKSFRTSCRKIVSNVKKRINFQ